METLIKVSYAHHADMSNRTFLAILEESYSMENHIKEFSNREIIASISKKIIECKRLNNWHFMNSRLEILKSLYEEKKLSKYGTFKEFNDSIFCIMPSDASHIHSIKLYDLDI